MAKILRADQNQLVGDIYGGWQSGASNVLAVLPTGGGKSVCVSKIANDVDQCGGIQAIIAHRNELVGQLCNHMADWGIKHRVIASHQSVSFFTAAQRREYGRSYINPDARAAVISVDTLLARASTIKPWLDQVQQWTIDECHHVLSLNKWGRAVALFPNARGLGVTASPTRADGMGLGRHTDGVFDVMVQGPTMRQLIDMGALCDYEIAAPEGDFYIEDEAITPNGDFSSKKMRKAVQRSHLTGDVVKEYIKHALFKRAICFATDVESAQEIAKNFNSMGISAFAISADTPDGVRDEYIRRFREGKLFVLVNVDLFGEGFDVPAVEVVIMARPTASLAVYLQQFGRALRVMFGKLRGLIIDHVGNWKRHGPPDKFHPWSLDRREKRGKKSPDPEEMALTNCKTCSRVYLKFLPKCPYCGALPPLPEPRMRTIEMVEGDLTLFDRERLAAMRAAMVMESPASIAQRVPAIASSYHADRKIEHIQSQQMLNDAIARWAGIGRAKGRTDSEMYKRFYHALGVDVYTALSESTPRKDMDAMREIIEGWL